MSSVQRLAVLRQNRFSWDQYESGLVHPKAPITNRPNAGMTSILDC